MSNTPQHNRRAQSFHGGGQYSSQRSQPRNSVSNRNSMPPLAYPEHLMQPQPQRQEQYIDPAHFLQQEPSYNLPEFDHSAPPQSYDHDQIPPAYSNAQSRRSSILEQGPTPVQASRQPVNTSFPLQVVIFREGYIEHQCSTPCHDPVTGVRHAKCMINYDPHTPRAGEIINAYTTSFVTFSQFRESIAIQLYQSGRNRNAGWDSNWPREQHLKKDEHIVEICILWGLADTPGWDGFVYRRYGQCRYTTVHEANYAKVLKLVEQRGGKDILQITVASGSRLIEGRNARQ